jgi:dolichyl-diphosphooligosaccharide--protein glycosyltransferase
MRFLLTRVLSQDLVSVALALACIAIVAWIRALPSTLPAADGLAEKIAEKHVREQIAPEVMRRFPPEQWHDKLETELRERLAQNPAQLAAEKQKALTEITSQLTYTGDDGRRYVYLDDYDSYLWLRNARSYLEHGTVCDAVVRSECRDNLGNAPLGYRMLYNRSLHTAAIVAVHRIANLFHAGYPLPASAFLVPIILGALGALPAFFLARRVGGNIAAIVAALTISLDPIYLARSAGSDNDVWNVVMPLYIAWTLVAGLSARKPSRAAAFAALAALLTGLHAAVWRGWVFAYVVLVCGALGCFALAALRQASAGGWRRAWRTAEVRAAGAATVIYALAPAVFTSFTGASALSVLRQVALKSAVASRGSTIWPATFSAVAELGKPLPMDVVQFMGGWIFFSLALLGLLALVLPQQHVKKRQIVIAACVLALFIAHYYSFAAVRLPRIMFLVLFIAPFAAELLIRAWKKEAAPMGETVIVIVIVWFFASLSQVYIGIRYIMLFAIPFGFAVGAFADRLRAVANALLTALSSQAAGFASAVSCAVALAVLFFPLQRGYGAMTTYYPAMNDAWWNTLVEIKNRSKSDAIVNAWWDYGYWIKYVAERKVSSDGGMLDTHVPHWLAKALLAPSDVESRGILRMLNCGSDATPLPEAGYGAFGKLTAMGVSEYRAYGFLVDLVKLDRAAADRYLAARGFNAEQRASLIASTHCAPPESFLVLSKEMIAKAEWWTPLGSWDVRRAYLARRTRLLPEPAALQDLARQGYKGMEAKALYDIVAPLRTQAEIDGFIAPPQRLIPTEWIPCSEAAGGMKCNITVTNPDGVARLEFFYDPAAPEDGRLRQGARVGTLGALVVAGNRALGERLDSGAAFRDIGVLLDVGGQRILVGTPLLVRSTLVRLFYLGGRYSRIFQPARRRTTLTGEEVATYKIDWGD